MAKEKMNRNNVVLYSDEKGIVKLSEEVMSAIVVTSAIHVKGVHALAGNITEDKLTKQSARTFKRTVKLVNRKDGLIVYVALVLDYGYSIPELTAEIKEKIKTTVETMMGINVLAVNIKVTDIYFK